MSERQSLAHDIEPQTLELPPELQATYERRQADRLYAIGCGDDRTLTPESKQALIRNGELAETGAYLRIFGGSAGVSRIVALAAIEKGYVDELDELGDSFGELTHAVAQRIVDTNENITPELHSAVKNEGNAATFHHDHRSPVGCAYCAGLGVVSRISTSDDHAELSAREDIAMFAQPASHRLPIAKQGFTRRYFPDPEIAGLSRADFTVIDRPVQILADEHAPVKDTLVAINFSPDLVSNPDKAHGIGRPFYNNDVTQIAEVILRSFPELAFDPETLLRTMVDDIRATRAALSPEEGAAALEVRRIGTPQQAIDYLEDVKASLP